MANPNPTPDAFILRKLRAADGRFTQAAELQYSGDLPARIGELNAAGYQIEQHPYLGYRLVSSPDRLIADDILSRLPDCQWIRRVIVYERTGSTNDLVAGMGRDGVEAGTVVFAEEQTAGRGRLGRRWQSDARQGLWFSVLLRPEIPVIHWPRLTLWIAYAVARGIHRLTYGDSPENAPLEVLLKWPNDLYLSGRKLAGILVESSIGENPFAVAGIGLNVGQTAFPSELQNRATSLRMETGIELDRNGLAAALLQSLDDSYPLVFSNFNAILDWASEADYLRGRNISATAGTVRHAGIAGGMDPDGALLIHTNAGEVVRLTSGEVTNFSSDGG